MCVKWWPVCLGLNTIKVALQVWCLVVQQQSGRSPKVVPLFLLQTLVAIQYDYFNSMIQSKRNNIFGTIFSSIYLAKREKRLVNLQRAKDGTHMFDAKYSLYVCSTNLIKSHAWYHTSLTPFTNECLPCNGEMLLNLVAKMKFYTFFISLSDDIIVDSCIISFNLNCIMQLKQFYNIATKVSSRKKCYYFWWSTWLNSGSASFCVNELLNKTWHQSFPTFISTIFISPFKCQRYSFPASHFRN